MIKFSNIADIIFMTKEDINNLGLKNYKTIINRNYKNKIIVFRLGNGEINVFNKGNFEKYKVYLVKKVKDTTDVEMHLMHVFYIIISITVKLKIV